MHFLPPPSSFLRNPGQESRPPGFTGAAANTSCRERPPAWWPRGARGSVDHCWWLRYNSTHSTDCKAFHRVSRLVVWPTRRKVNAARCPPARSPKPCRRSAVSTPAPLTTRQPAAPAFKSHRISLPSLGRPTPSSAGARPTHLFSHQDSNLNSQSLGGAGRDHTRQHGVEGRGAPGAAVYNVMSAGHTRALHAGLRNRG